MDQTNITLNLLHLMCQQNALLMQKMVEHTREVQELILTKHKILPSDSDFYSSQEYYENDQIKVEAQDENLEQDDNQIAYQREQSQKQLIYQLSNLKKARQNELDIGDPVLIDDIYFHKDLVRTPVYIQANVQSVQLEEERLQKYKRSIKKKVKFSKKLQQRDKLEQKQEFQDLAQVDPQLEVQINQIIPELTFVAADKVKKQQNSRQERKLKRDQQKISQNEEENIKKPKYRKIVKDQQCLSCGKHEASDHRILRSKSLFDNGLQNKIHSKNEKSQQEQIQSYEIQNN